MASSGFRVPHTLVLLFGMVVLALLLTYVLPQGHFERITTSTGREQVVPGTYTPVETPTTLSPLVLFTGIPRGFGAAQEIIFFVFIIGGAFGVFRATGAADALIDWLLRRVGGRPALLVGAGMALFAMGSAAIGMAEEYLPFVPILLALGIGLGFDPVAAIGILCVGYGVGYGAALINPFTVFIAQDIAGLPQASGIAYRAVLLVVFLAIGYHHVWRYARRVKADPSKSIVADLVRNEAAAKRVSVTLTATHVAVLATIGAFLALLLIGLKQWHWYLIEMGALFLGLTVALGVVGRLGFDRTAKEFCTGAAELTTTALLIGFARTIQIVLDDGQVVDTIVNGIAAPLRGLGPQTAAVGMLFVQSLCNFFIPSGSGQAYVTMPIMAPLADLVHVHRQVAVLAYQFGDGFTNIIIPTNPVLVGILAMAGIPFDRWVRFLAPLMLKIVLVAAGALVLAVWMGYS